MNFPITLGYAGFLALLTLALKLNVIRLRWKNQVALGDGGNRGLLQAIRVHGNLIENDVLALIVLAMLEVQGLASVGIHGLGAAMVIGRLLHVQGLLGSAKSSFGRVAGTIITNFVLLIGGGLALYLALLG